MSKNLKKFIKHDSSSYFKRNYFKSSDRVGYLNIDILHAVKRLNLKFSNFLEIGCSGGEDLNQFKNSLFKYNKKKVSFTGIDVSKDAIKYASKKFKSIKFLKLSSLELNKIKNKFDMINMGWMLYLLDREEIFNQFNQIYNKININGYLSIIDFQPLFSHTNVNEHTKKFNSYKSDYSTFLESSNLFREIYSVSFEPNMKTKKKFIDRYISVKIYKKIKEDVFAAVG